MIHTLSTLALGPLLLLQGRRVRATVERLPEPVGAREGELPHANAEAPPLRLLILGDSAAAGVGADTQDEALAGQLVACLREHGPLYWRLQAFTGAETRDILASLAEMPAEPVDVVVTSLGVNDVTGRVSLRDWRQRQRDLIEVLSRKFGARHILLGGLPPMHLFPALPQPLRWYLGRRARQFSSELARLAATYPQCGFVAAEFGGLDGASMARDGFHPGPAVYRAWAQQVAERIVQRLGNVA